MVCAACRYAEKLAKFKLNRELEAQLQALCTGFADVVDLPSVRMFSEAELSELVSGRQTIDLDDLQKHTRYTFGYVCVVSHSSEQVHNAWPCAATRLPLPRSLGSGKSCRAGHRITRSAFFSLSLVLPELQQVRPVLDVTSPPHAPRAM